MTRPLQDFAQSDYHRPHLPQQELPTTPIAFDDDVTVTQTSLRKKRSVFVLASVAFTLGALLILFNSPMRNDFLAPGPLASPHANILKGEQRCAACHQAADFSVTQWMQDLVSGGSHLDEGQSEKCMECHSKTLLKDYALNAHGTSPEYLSAITDQQKSKFQNASFDTGMIFEPPTNDHNEIACAACHREHHGAHVNLMELTDQQCQSCHTNVFHSFETDHPEFTNWPQRRRERIAFDHATHMGKHFKTHNAEFNCSQCHVDDAYGEVKQLAGYEQACASCHNEQVVNSSQDGLKLFSLPTIDIDAIRIAKRGVGQWPESATGGFDGPIPPLMRSLLSANDEARELLTNYGDEFDFADIDPDDMVQVAEAAEMVWHIKQLFYDLASSGPDAIKSRLEKVTGRSLSDAELRRLSQGIDATVFRDAAKRWLPDLLNEVPQYRKGNAPATVTWKPSEADLLFYLASDGGADGELAANPLKKLLAPQLAQPIDPGTTRLELPDTKVYEQSAEQGRDLESRLLQIVTNPPPANEPKTNQFVDGHQPDDLAVNPLKRLLAGGGVGGVGSGTQPPATQPASPVDTAAIRNPTVTPQPRVQVPLDQPGPDLLAENPVKKLFGGGFEDPLDAKPATNPINQNPNLNRDVAGDVPAAGDPSTLMLSPPATVNAANLPAPTITAVNVKSGWFRDDLSFAITYQPSGHADPFMVSWTDLVTGTANAHTRHETKQLFERVTSPTGVGNCRSCHTVDEVHETATRSQFVTNWKAVYRSPDRKEFTKFSHGPHLLLADCQSCHSLNTEVSIAEKFHDFDGLASQSNFHPVVKANCASCHSKGQTDNSCTTCHNYHVGSDFKSTVPSKKP